MREYATRQRLMAKVRYKLHWNSRDIPPVFKWVIYDWKFKTPIAYAETRIQGRLVCWYYNTIFKAGKVK